MLRYIVMKNNIYQFEDGEFFGMTPTECIVAYLTADLTDPLIISYEDQIRQTLGGQCDIIFPQDGSMPMVLHEGNVYTVAPLNEFAENAFQYG